MLNDIFANRYAQTPLRDGVTPNERDSRLLRQTIQILLNDIKPMPFENWESASLDFWINVHDNLAREFGKMDLRLARLPPSRNWTLKVMGVDKFEILHVVQNWMICAPTGLLDLHVKERISLIELALRQREGMIRNSPAASSEALHEKTLAEFRACIDEINTRFRQAGYPLHYHNGFIQFSTDALVETEIEAPFWDLLSDPIWKNVDIDMKEALDLRDTDGRDPAFYAAKALESAIKIISDQRKLTLGGEKGAVNYIENLGSKRSGHFIGGWEETVLKKFFSDVRNPFGHGPGSEDMPKLSRQQTDWAIEFCMSWIKSLIRRM